MYRAASVAGALLLLGGCGGAHRPAAPAAPVSRPAPAPAPAPGTTTTVSSTGATAAQTSPPLTHEQVIGRGDGLCARADRTLRRLDRRVAAAGRAIARGSAVYSSLLAAVRAAAAVSTRTLDSFRQLTPPPEDSAVIARYLGEQASSVQLELESAQALAGGDTESYSALAIEARDQARAAAGIARDYGFRVCGRAGGS